MNKLKTLPRVLFFIGSAILFIVLSQPIWRIELYAPQYPEGLVLKIHADKLAGDVDIVNGLNHYIGMRTLHAEDFVEFKVLPYIIVFFGSLGLLFAFINNRKLLYTWLVLFALFAILAMIDFWRWEYEYGHNLDPMAAIQIPGMAYQPPLIGFKQLLNFGAYSVPDIGGWILISSGVLALVASIMEWRGVKKLKSSMAGLALVSMLSLSACNPSPKPLQMGKDLCEHCKMTLTDARFGGEIITKKGKVFVFDDVVCLKAYKQNSIKDSNDIKEIVFINFLNKDQFISADEAFFLKSEALKSPMGSNIAAFENTKQIEKVSADFAGESLLWGDIDK